MIFGNMKSGCTREDASSPDRCDLGIYTLPAGSKESDVWLYKNWMQAGRGILCQVWCCKEQRGGSPAGNTTHVMPGAPPCVIMQVQADNGRCARLEEPVPRDKFMNPHNSRCDFLSGIFVNEANFSRCMAGTLVPGTAINLHYL
jgi:hypothetical protein